MSKAENFIREQTKRCSEGVRPFEDWITPDQARKALEIAREEMIESSCNWIEENIGEYCDGENTMFSATHIENIDIFGQERFVNDLKQAMK